MRLEWEDVVTLALAVSIHAPREGCDRSSPSTSTPRRSFNSRTPGGVRLLPSGLLQHRLEFQFTHPGRGATWLGGVTHQPRGVSIHAPREGCDVFALACLWPKLVVSIHAPREGCDFAPLGLGSPAPCFNSRTPGGVRLTKGRGKPRPSCFNSRTPGGVRQHHRREGVAGAVFQFTHPGRGATEEG